MSEPDTDEPEGMACYDCDRRFARRDLQMREIVVTHEDRSGYDMVPVPLCRACIGERFGYECPQCGIRHDDKTEAKYCCRRRPGDAPDCPECGRRMERGAFGFDPATPAGMQRTVEWAECEACGIGWGRFTGWHDLDAEDSDMNEVPLDLQRQIENTEGEDKTAYEGIAEFVDAVEAADPPESCPECEAQLIETDVFADGEGAPVAVRLVCRDMHADGTIGTYIYEVAEDALYLEDESEPETITGDFEEES